MSDAPCPYCTTNDIAEECWHSAELWELMTALAAAIGVVAPADVSPEVAIGWEDDADGLLGRVGEAPYRIHLVPDEDRMEHVEFAAIINDVLCVAFNYHGDTNPLEAIVWVRPGVPGDLT